MNQVLAMCYEYKAMKKREAAAKDPLDAIMDDLRETADKLNAQQPTLQRNIAWLESLAKGEIQ